MTVAELIKELNKMPKDAEVLDEDDYEVYKVELEEYFGKIIVCLKHRV